MACRSRTSCCMATMSGTEKSVFFIANSNQMPFPPAYPYAERKVGFEWPGPSRYNRVIELLKESLDPDRIRSEADPVAACRSTRKTRHPVPEVGRRGATEPAPIRLRIPTQSGRGFRFDVGHRSDLIPATIPK